MVKYTLLLLSVFSAVASAQPPSEQSLTPSQREEALFHYNIGRKKYAVGNFFGAAMAFEEAAEITAQPAIIYNLAQSYRLANRPSAAMTNYKAFLLIDPETPLRAEVEQHILNLGKLIADMNKREREEARKKRPEVAWKGQIVGYWTVDRRTYYTDCLTDKDKVPWDMSALVGTEMIRLEECGTVQLMEDGKLAQPVACYTSRGVAMNLTRGHMNWEGDYLLLTGTVKRFDKEDDSQTCAVSYGVSFKREPYEPGVREARR